MVEGNGGESLSRADAACATIAAMPALRGTFRILILYDLSEEIRLETVRRSISAEPAAREPAFTRPAPEYVRFERPPVIEPLSPTKLETGETLRRRVKYFDYGIVSLDLAFDFAVDWPGLVALSSRWVSSPDVERRTSEFMRAHLETIRPALVKAYEEWATEDYYIIQLDEARGDDGATLDAKALLAAHGSEIAQIVRGESIPLAEGERQEVLQSSLSYYPTDLLVAGWVAALIYDTPAGAAPLIQLVEYANSQLLEFRHYDLVLTRLLADVYRYLERKGRFWQRWQLAREAERLNTIRLDVMELTERTDNAIKFLSDMFYARVYRLAADKVGVTDYRRLVDAKLRNAGELYEFMQNEFHQARGFVLEIMVVAILIIELAFLFRGK
jgi:hypothetical protein